MELEEFKVVLSNLNTDEEIIDFCRKYVLHGIPFVFNERDSQFYDFRKKIRRKA